MEPTWHVLPDGVVAAIPVPDPWRGARWALVGVLAAFACGDWLFASGFGIAFLLLPVAVPVNLVCDGLARYLRVELTSTGLAVHEHGWRALTPRVHALTRKPAPMALKARIPLAEVRAWGTDVYGVWAEDDRGDRVRFHLPEAYRQALLETVRPAWERARSGLTEDLEATERSRHGVGRLVPDS